MVFEKFIDANKITISSKRAYRNQYMSNQDSERMDHWQTTIKMNGKQYTTVFSQGSYFKGASPKLEDVLDSLRMETSAVQDGYSWYLDSFGIEDTREEQKRYSQMEKTEEKLKIIFGDQFERFMNIDDNEETEDEDTEDEYDDESDQESGEYSFERDSAAGRC